MKNFYFCMANILRRTQNLNLWFQPENSRFEVRDRSSRTSWHAQWLSCCKNTSGWRRWYQENLLLKFPNMYRWGVFFTRPCFWLKSFPEIARACSQRLRKRRQIWCYFHSVLPSNITQLVRFPSWIFWICSKTYKIKSDFSSSILLRNK